MIKKVTVGIFTVLIILVLLGYYADGNSKEVRMVKGGVLQSCPNRTVERMVNSFMASPSWESGASSSGVSFVNIKGNITLYNKPVKALLQFSVNRKKETFQYNAFEINKVPQNNLMAISLLEKMCISAMK